VNVGEGRFVGWNMGASAESIGFCVGGVCISTADTGVWGRKEMYGCGCEESFSTGVAGVGVVMEMLMMNGVYRYWCSTFGCEWIIILSANVG